MQTRAILQTARQLLAEARPLIDERGLTLVGVAVGNLDTDGAVQLELPFELPVEDSLDTALDAVRDRFGSSSVTRAASLGRSLDPAVPILAD
jgi:DNA polymerase-4